jgi:hypothetical protein
MDGTCQQQCENIVNRVTRKQIADRAAIRRVISLLQSQHTEDLAVVEVLKKLLED